VPSFNDPNWELLKNDYLASVPEFFYLITDGQVVYFERRANNSWRQLSNAWTGRFDRMINHWIPHNSYQNGDIVVYGITGTNTYRYFRMRNGVDAGQTAGIPPFSLAGSIYWEPIR